MPKIQTGLFQQEEKTVSFESLCADYKNTGTFQRDLIQDNLQMSVFEFLGQCEQTANKRSRREQVSGFFVGCYFRIMLVLMLGSERVGDKLFDGAINR